MANGPATPLIQQALLTLLNGREASPLAPVPLAPTGGIGPLDFDTSAALAALQPQPVPPALPGPVDAEAIRSRFAGMAGPEPVAPTVGPTSLVIRIARALQGFGAGVQGQGPQFLAGLREEREAPMREFRARKERFETRRQELGAMGEQAVMSAEERRAARTAELLDRQAERDFQESLKRSGIKSQEAIARMKEAFDLEREARKAEAERLEREKKDAKERKQAVITLANTFTDDFRIPREQARRFAAFEIEGTPLSQADAKKYSKIEKYRAPTGAAGTGASGKVMVEIQNEDGSTSVVPFATVSSAVNAGTITQGPRGVFVEGQPPAPPSFTPSAADAAFPPMMGAPSGPLSASQDGQVFTRAQVQAHAKKTGRNPAEIEADLKARGFQVR